MKQLLPVIIDKPPTTVQGNVQLGTDLAQSPALGIQLCGTLNVHRATVTTRVQRTLTSGAVRTARWPAAVSRPIVDGN
jgi:hypothetical protein